MPRNFAWTTQVSNSTTENSVWYIVDTNLILNQMDEGMDGGVCGWLDETFHAKTKQSEMKQ